MENLKIYLHKYKKFLFPGGMGIASFFVLFIIIIPQFQEIGKLNKEIDSKKMNVKNLEESLETISKTGEETVDSDLTTVTTALPSAKDISLVFTVLTSASSLAEVDLTGFSLKVGGVYGGAKDLSASVTGFPLLSVDVTVKAPSKENLTEFLVALNNKLPLSEVKKISSTDDVSTLELNFYYKPYDLAILANQDKISPMSLSEKKLLEELRDWEK